MKNNFQNKNMNKIVGCRRFLSDPKGITLISLVIIIILLIILAGVAISLSLGENGIFRKAQFGAQSYANAQVKEETEIAKAINDINSYVSGNRELIMVDKNKYEQLLTDVENLKKKTIRFPDYSKVLTSITAAGAKWTATEDCFVAGYARVTAAGGTAIVYVDGIGVMGVANTNLSSEKLTSITDYIYVKKGSVVTTREGASYEYGLTVYGLQE